MTEKQKLALAQLVLIVRVAVAVLEDPETRKEINRLIKIIYEKDKS